MRVFGDVNYAWTVTGCSRGSSGPDTVSQNRINEQTLSKTENIPAGIAWMLLTMFWFVTLDTTAKFLMQHYSVVQVIWARFFFHTIFVIAIIRLTRPSDMRSSKMSLQLWRSILMLTTTAFFFLGISEAQLATASTIMFLASIIVTVLAIPILGEHVGIVDGLGYW